MRVVVFGGRDYTDRDRVYSILDRCYTKYGDDLEIISGMARGADRLAWEWCKGRGVKCHEFPADWVRHKKAAGPIRNQQMIDEGRPNFGIGFPGGDGTEDMFRRLHKVPVRTIRVT